MCLIFWKIYFKINEILIEIAIEGVVYVVQGTVKLGKKMLGE